MWVGTARLPIPPGINATYKTGSGRFYKGEKAKQWQSDALLLLRAAGFRTGHADTVLKLDLELGGSRLDLDAPLKLAIDTIAEALGVDDRCLVRLEIRRSDQIGLLVRASLA